MKLDIGSEKRFLDFIKNLKDTDKIALISHNDLDGIVAPFVVSKVVNSEIIKFVGYEGLNEELILLLKEKEINKVIFTDLYIGNRSFLKDLENFSEILILDHHLSKEDWNSSRTTFIKGEDGYSAGYLCYHLFSKIKNLEKIDWVVACCCISDYCHIKTADWLTEVFAKYGDRFEIQGSYVRTSGPIWDIQESISYALIYFKGEHTRKVFDFIGEKFGDIGNLGEHANEVRKEVERQVALFEKNKHAFPGGYLMEIKPLFSCTSIVSNIISGRYLDKIIILMKLDTKENAYHLSVRRQDGKQNMSDFLKNLLKGMPNANGGGHVPAAGGSFPKEQLGEFKKRLGVKA